MNKVLHELILQGHLPTGVHNSEGRPAAVGFVRIVLPQLSDQMVFVPVWWIVCLNGVAFLQGVQFALTHTHTHKYLLYR